MGRNPSRRGRKGELFTSIDLDSRKNSTPHQGCLQRCRFLRYAPVSIAVVSPASQPVSDDGRLERAETREAVAVINVVENGDRREIVGGGPLRRRRRRKVLARKRKRVEDDVCSDCSSEGLPKDCVSNDCVLNAKCDDFRDVEGNEKTVVAKEGFLELDENQTENAVSGNGPRPIFDRCIESRYENDCILNTEPVNVVVEKGSKKSIPAQEGPILLDDIENENVVNNNCRPIIGHCIDSEYAKDSVWNAGYEDLGIEEGGETSTSAKEEFHRFGIAQTGKAEVPNRDGTKGEHDMKSECGRVPEGDPKPVVTAMKKPPTSTIVSSGKKDDVKSSAYSGFNCPLSEKDRKNHDSSGSCSYTTAPCDHDMSQEAISDSIMPANLYDVIKVFSRRRDRRREKGDILIVADEKGIKFSPPQWWRPGGYGTEEVGTQRS